MSCFFILSIVCGKQSTGWWSICDGRTDVRLEFWNVLKRNIPVLLSCFQAVSSYLRLCYSAGAQKARRPHEKQIGLYWLFWEMFGALNPFRPSVYQTFWNQCERMWCTMVCRFAMFTFHVSIFGEKSFPNHHSQSTYVLQEAEPPQRKLGHVQYCHKFIHFLEPDMNKMWIIWAVRH